MMQLCSITTLVVGLIGSAMGAGPTPGTDSNYEVKTGNFNYLPPLDTLKPYGDLGGKAFVARTARGTTLFSVALNLNETASLPPQTVVNFQFFHGSCEMIASGYNVQVQDPATCPWSPDSATCTTGEVQLVPTLEVNFEGNLDSTGRVITAYDWTVYIPSSAGEFSLVVFDPSFPPGYFKMACANMVSDRSTSTEVFTVPANVVAANPPATVTADITHNDLGHTNLRVRLGNFGNTGLYEFAVRALPCSIDGNNASPLYLRSLDCNLVGGAPIADCDESNPDNIVSGIIEFDGEEVTSFSFLFDFLIRADGQAVVLFKCSNLSPPGGCIHENVNPFACLDFDDHTDLVETTTTASPVSSQPSPSPTVNPSPFPTAIVSVTVATTIAKDGGAVTYPTTDDPQNRNNDQPVCGMHYEPVGPDDRCCLPISPSVNFFEQNRAGSPELKLEPDNDDDDDDDGQKKGKKEKSPKKVTKNGGKLLSTRSKQHKQVGHFMVNFAMVGFAAVILVTAFMAYRKEQASTRNAYLDYDLEHDNTDNEYAMPSLLPSGSVVAAYGTANEGGSAPFQTQTRTPERCSIKGLRSRSRTPPGKDVERASDIVFAAVESTALIVANR